MNWRKATYIMLLAALGVMLVAAPAYSNGKKALNKEQVEEMIKGWPKPSQNAAREMIQKYGDPWAHSSGGLTWGDKGPWMEIIVYSEEIPHEFPKPHTDVLEQVVSHRVPVEQFDDLAQFNGSILADRTRGTLAARCDSEGANLLALNLAHDLITGKKTVQEARQYYASAMETHMNGGKVDRYMEKLWFEPDGRAKANDVDKPMIQSAGR